MDTLIEIRKANRLRDRELFTERFKNIIVDNVRLEIPQVFEEKDRTFCKDLSDPLTIFLSDTICDYVFAEFSLSNMLIEFIKECEQCGDFAYGLKQISIRMKELCIIIDNVCEKHKADSK